MDDVIIYRHQLFKPSEPFIRQQASALTGFAPLYVGRSIEGQPPAGCRCVTLKSVSKASLVKQVIFRDTDSYLRLLENYAPRLVHAHFGVEGVYAMPLAQKLGIPLITTFHGFDATVSRSSLLASRKVSWVNYLLFRRQLAQRGDLFIAVSDFIHQKLLTLGFPGNKIVTHYIGIDVAHIEPKKDYRATGTIVHVARLVEKKGTSVLIKAFALLRATVPEARLVIIGDGPLRDKLIAQVAHLGIEESVEFRGSLSNKTVLEEIKRADVFCLPSLTSATGDAEGLGMVLLEAAASGIPLVGTNHGGIPEVIRDGVNGYLVPENDPGALFEQLQTLLTNDSLRIDFGRRARSMLESSFDICKQAKKLEMLYNSVM